MTLLGLHALVARILHNATLAALSSGKPLTHKLVISTAERRQQSHLCPHGRLRRRSRHPSGVQQMNINDILKRNPRALKYGAPLGDSDNNNGGTLYLQRIQFVDGDYAPDGTYWGGGRGTEPLYCAFNEHSRVYVRAKSRKLAQAAVLEQYEDATFHRREK